MNFTDRDLRQRDVVPPAKLAECCALVVGLGAVGRQLALQLSAMGVPSMTLVDHDTVEVVNLAVQGFSPAEIGSTKVRATAECCQRCHPEMSIDAIAQRFG